MSESDIRVGDRFAWDGGMVKAVWTVEEVCGSRCTVRSDSGRFNGSYPVEWLTTTDGWTRLPREPKCRPDCTPAVPCRTEAVCPVFDEKHISSAENMRLKHLAERWGMRINEAREADANLRLAADRAEARAWRSQRYEPALNGLGAMVGRYRYERGR